jgi:hypothetical protein
MKWLFGFSLQEEIEGALDDAESDLMTNEPFAPRDRRENKIND